MIAKNRYYRRSRIAEKRFRRIIRYFSLDFSASDTARLSGISVRSINAIYIKIRQRLAEDCEKPSHLAGQIEVDESYFGPKRIRGKRGRGAGSKTIVFGVFKRNDRVYTEIVPDPVNTLFKRLFGGRLTWRALSIPMAGAGTTDWLMSAIRSIFVLSTETMSLQMTSLILMALSPFGLTPSCA